MKLMRALDVEKEDIVEEGAKDITIRWLISDRDGAENFAMRLFEVKPSGYTPYHQHDWEHEVYILGGTGTLKTEGGDKPLKEGDIVFVKPMEWHSFRNAGEGRLRFLCLVPCKG